MRLNKKDKAALTAAYPFGGVAQANERPTLEKLKGLGFITIDYYSTLDSSLGYSLTEKGRQLERHWARSALLRASWGPTL